MVAVVGEEPERELEAMLKFRSTFSGRTEVEE